MSRQRSKSRTLALQALYQWQIGGQDVAGIINHFMVEQGDSKKFDPEYFRELVSGVTHNTDRLDEALRPFLHRSVDSVDPVELAALRIGTFELADHPEIPYRVVINEAVELAKVFGAEQGHKYVNGVLDKVAQAARPLEMQVSR